MANVPTVPKITFVHCADLHLDSPFEGIGAVAPEIAQVLREATFKAFDNVVNLAIRERADFLIIAGDVYDGADRSLRAQLKFRDGLVRASAAGVRSFVVHGNHDPLDGWEVDLPMPQEVHRFGGQDVECREFIREGEHLADVYGISFSTREMRQNLASRFRRSGRAPFAIGLLHANVGGQAEHDNYAPCTIEDLKATRMDYWALGHIHGQQTVHAANPCVVYPGNTQGRSVREAGPRTCCVVRVDGAGKIACDFQPCDAIRWFDDEETTVTIEALAGMDDLIEELNFACQAARTRAGGLPAVVRLRVRGQGDLHTALRRDDAERTLTARLREEQAAGHNFVWVESVRIATRPAIDLAARRKVEDFVGDFLRAADELRAQPDPSTALKGILRNRTEFSRIAQHLEALGPAEWESLLRDAEAWGLDRLLSSEI